MQDQSQNQSSKFEELSEMPDELLLPVLDRANCDETQLNGVQKSWRKQGFVILENFLPDRLIERYCSLRSQFSRLGGWSCPTPYMYYRELRDICLYAPLMEVMESLIGEEMGLHLNLTGWVSTTRDWHQDDYLNPPFVNSGYTAVWMALDDIHPDAGPFEFVQGSHKWPLLRRELVWNQMGQEEILRPDWPAVSERVCVPAFEDYISRKQAQVDQFLGKRGDVLIWHGRLAHRGSQPKNPNLERKALIAHYSSIKRRTDMPFQAKWKNGKRYFIHGNPLDAGSPTPTISKWEKYQKVGISFLQRLKKA
jgi:Phytanoyl-CoA dioxygenase (PhyH)